MKIDWDEIKETILGPDPIKLLVVDFIMIVVVCIVAIIISL